MLSNILRLPYRMLLESGDCTQARFSQDFFKKFLASSKPEYIVEENEEDGKLHPINRFFAALDPEMWELSDQPSPEMQKRKPLPSAFLSRLFMYLPFNDLKTGRLACKQWNHLINLCPRWTNDLVAVVDGDKAPWSDILMDSLGGKCAEYLETSKHGFQFWSRIRLRNIKSHNLHPLIKFYACAFEKSVEHMKMMELIRCQFTWPEFLDVMYLFRGLESLQIIHCQFGYHVTLSDTLMSLLGQFGRPDYQELLADVNYKCPRKHSIYKNLKSLGIHECDDQDKTMTPLLLTLLKTRTGQMDEFLLFLGYKSALLRDTRDQNCLCQCIHSFLSQKNVVKCVIQAENRILSGLANRFFTYMSLWKKPPRDSENWRMKELKIHLRPLILWNSFERNLLPLFQRFPSLKLLSLKHIILRGNKAHLLKELMQQCSEECKLEIGLISDDQGGQEASNMEKELISSQLYQKNIVSLDIVIHTDSVREVRDMIPYKKNVIFQNIKSFTVSTNGVCRPRFFTFNVNVIIHNFPNLTELQIVDGPPCKAENFFSSYAGVERIWKEMSGAVVGDDDMQLILKSLTKLKTLVLRVNMKYITDSGFTGFSNQYCRRVSKCCLDDSSHAKSKISALEILHRDGVSFAHLPDLRHLSIEGIGPNVTDVTSYLAFRKINPSTPKFIGLFGAHHISKAGKESIVNMFPECEVFIT